jgi:ATP-dependent Lon protease
MSVKNKIDLIEIPDKVKNDLEFHFVENIGELLNYVFGEIDHTYMRVLEPPQMNNFENLNFNVL